MLRSIVINEVSRLARAAINPRANKRRLMHRAEKRSRLEPTLTQADD
jgi:hypothetical protein